MAIILYPVYKDTSFQLITHNFLKINGELPSRRLGLPINFLRLSVFLIIKKISLERTSGNVNGLGIEMLDMYHQQVLLGRTSGNGQLPR